MPMSTDQAIAQSATEELTSYDEVPYSSYPSSQTHPYRLAVMGSLFGLNTTPVHRCRVLELGSASGGNIIPAAAVLPESQFIGIDLSSVQINDGKRMVESLGLTNIELKHLSIMDVNESLGQFDYIVCHGVFSWVPEEVRKKILDICAQQLSPQGVAYISYNCYPGWHMRGTVRDMMLFHSLKYDKPQEKVGHARALLDFLVKSVSEDSGPYGALLKKEMELMRNQADHYVLHEHLETVNQPMYFYQFARQADEAGLQFLAEAELAAMSLQGLTADVRNIVKQLSKNLVECEQYIDFIRNRTFRRTLLCRKDATLDRRGMNPRVRGYHLNSSAVPEGTVDVPGKETAKFKLAGGTLSTEVPVIKAALLLLSERWPQTMPFEDLLDESLRRMGHDPRSVAAQRERMAEFLAENMVQCFAQRAVNFFPVSLPLPVRAGERPRGFRVARLQAEKEGRVTSLLHELVNLNEFDRQILLMADGRSTRRELVDRLARDVREGKLQASQPINDPSQLQANVEKALDESLKRLQRVALLEA